MAPRGLRSGQIPNDAQGAFRRDNHVALAGAAAGPLAGLTFGVKDLFHIEGHRTGFGQPDWLRTHGPATETATAVRQLLDAGADMAGKTQTDELAYSLTGENVHYGTPVNSADADRVPGGSSSGSAAAVGGGLVDFALGSDCGGSVRLPASYCGILGIRPTHGRVSLAGAIPFGPSFDVAGWFARDAALFERVGAVLLGADAEPAPLRRVIRATDAFAMVDGAVREALVGPMDLIAAEVGALADMSVCREGLRAWMEVFRTLQAAEVWGNHGAWVREVGPALGPGIRERFEWAATVTDADVAASAARRKEIVTRLEGLLRPGDVLCLPTSPRVAPYKGTATDTIEIEYRHQALCLLCIAGLGGLPQLSLPLGRLGGLPLGLSLIGRRGSDLGLLALTRRIMARTRD